MTCTVLGHVDGETYRAAEKRIAELRVAIRRSVACIEMIKPYVMWDECDAQEDKVEATLQLLREEICK